MSGRKQFDVDTALDQAMRTFWEYGYAHTSVDQLATATGLGRGSLYGTFGGKDALFLQALNHYATTYGDRQQQALDAHPHDPVSALRAFYDVTLTRIADPTVPDGCLITESASAATALPPETRTRVHTLLQLQQARIHEVLAAAAAPNADNLSLFLIAVNQSLAVMHRAGTPPPDLRAITEAACAALADALAAE
ncbi:TetR/AcrR family transcriptional regulator [Nocardia macrotermitis]|uniref:HTH-type transcriptional repressor ComR n=1 Tax=Nocardia macrotermitis TaxID=2585198 RepID=A0A7K0DES4_9NOCA|nr:TetR/AcrR family transcriptional regulator [Nocardia macrotermitis]MQY24168.1 HTH-type transcriptional repressor ComR [Nocardia macrotermitis]